MTRKVSSTDCWMGDHALCNGRGGFGGKCICICHEPGWNDDGKEAAQ